MRGRRWGCPRPKTGRDGTVQSFSYNAAGQLTTATEDADGGSLGAGYYLNGWLRNTSTAQPDTSARYQNFKYWGDGAEAWRTFGNDPTFAQSESIQGFAYNDARALTMATAVGWGFAWDNWNISHDRAGRTISMTDPPNGAAPARTTTLDRNPDGTVAEQTLHSGAAGTSVIDQWAYTYDATGRVGSRARTGAAGSLSEVYGYDEAGRLATIDSDPVSYDPNGNRLSGQGMPTLTFRADNSIAAGPGPNGSGTETYLYAPWGGLTRDACRSYSYDGFDRARNTTVRQDALGLLPRCLDLSDPAGELLAPNDLKRYDPLGRNIWARHQTLNLAGVTVSTEYVNLHHVGLDQAVAYEQTVGAPARSGRYVNTPGGTPLAVSDNNGSYQFLHRDGQGDTVAAIRPNGSLACGPELDPWGETGAACTDGSSTATPNRKWYNSSRLDTATGTYQWGARTYNPTTAAWLEPDTPARAGAPSHVSIGSDPLVANRYSYVNGDPINYTDPSGHRLCAARHCRDREQDAADLEKEQLIAAYVAHTGTPVTDPIAKILGDCELSGLTDFIDFYTKSEACRGAQALLSDPLRELALFLETAVDEFSVVLEFAGVSSQCIEEVRTGGAGEDCLKNLVAEVAITAGTGSIGKLVDLANSARRTVRGADDAVDITRKSVDDLVEGLCSFSGDTEVLMADGSTKPISDIEIGDLVLAEDPETGERGPREVTHLWVHEDQILDLRVEGGARISTTEDHPFWNETDGDWQRADALDPGDLLLTASGERVYIESIDYMSQQSTAAYNLSIDDLHTYFVAAGREHVLVHNICGDDVVRDILKTKKGSIRNAELPPGAPSWDDISDMPYSQIEAGAKANLPGYKTIKKLLTDKRFDR